MPEILPEKRAESARKGSAMLTRLYIENIALIDRLDLPLSAGFNVLTGETGAGKSIIIDAVNLLLGGRADRDLIRSGRENAVAEGIFDVSPAVREKLGALGVEAEEGQLILSRELSSSGRNVCRINGRLASLSLLRETGALLVDVHGQHQNQTLLSPEQHLAFLDHFAKGELSKEISAVRECYGQWDALRRKLQKGFGTEAERARRSDMLTFQIDEIDGVNPQPDEEEALLSERELLSHAEQIQTALSGACGDIYGTDGEEETMGALALLQQAAARLEEIAPVHSRYETACQKLREAGYALEDVAMDVRSMREEDAFDPYRLNEVEERLSQLHSLKKKYGATIGEVLAFRAAAQKELEQMESDRILAEEGEKQLAALRKTLYDRCVRLSEKRREQAVRLEEQMLSELHDLGMEKAAFALRFAPVPSSEQAEFRPDGFDQVEMLLSTNPGEPVKPLQKVASGGELSRIMLAFKSVEAELFSRPCLIFDEIDTGISGRIAAVVGRKMHALSKFHQVLCVTHSAQIAALADAHYLIEKTQREGGTTTAVRRLDGEERVAEVARIISGDVPSAAALDHARSLIAAEK